jgi:GNAT superfamily N-acetyltransferase
MASADSTIFVAEEEGEILGFGEVYFREDQPSRGLRVHTYGHLQSMFVCSGRRHEGIGTKLLQACESWAKTLGAEEMRLDIWEFREGPLGFYESTGYRTLRRSMIRKLG